MAAKRKGRLSLTAVFNIFVLSCVLNQHNVSAHSGKCDGENTVCVPLYAIIIVFAIVFTLLTYSLIITMYMHFRIRRSGSVNHDTGNQEAPDANPRPKDSPQISSERGSSRRADSFKRSFKVRARRLSTRLSNSSGKMISRVPGGRYDASKFDQKFQATVTKVVDDGDIYTEMRALDSNMVRPAVTSTSKYSLTPSSNAAPRNPYSSYEHNAIPNSSGDSIKISQGLYPDTTDLCGPVADKESGDGACCPAYANYHLESPIGVAEDGDVFMGEPQRETINKKGDREDEALRYVTCKKFSYPLPTVPNDSISPRYGTETREGFFDDNLESTTSAKQLKNDRLLTNIQVQDESRCGSMGILGKRTSDGGSEGVHPIYINYQTNVVLYPEPHQAKIDGTQINKENEGCPLPNSKSKDLRFERSSDSFIPHSMDPQIGGACEEYTESLHSTREVHIKASSGDPFPPPVPVSMSFETDETYDKYPPCSQSLTCPNIEADNPDVFSPSIQNSAEHHVEGISDKYPFGTPNSKDKPERITTSKYPSPGTENSENPQIESTDDSYPQSTPDHKAMDLREATGDNTRPPSPPVPKQSHTAHLELANHASVRPFYVNDPSNRRPKMPLRGLKSCTYLPELMIYEDGTASLPVNMKPPTSDGLSRHEGHYYRMKPANSFKEMGNRRVRGVSLDCEDERHMRRKEISQSYVSSEQRPGHNSPHRLSCRDTRSRLFQPDPIISSTVLQEVKGRGDTECCHLNKDRSMSSSYPASNNW